jgi:hypothetical protein
MPLLAVSIVWALAASDVTKVPASIRAPKAGTFFIATLLV